MRELLLLAVHLIVTIAKLMRPGGARAVAAESLLLKHQLQISNRSRHRAPNLTSLDRFVLGLTTLFIKRARIAKLAAILRPATLLKFHKALVDGKYRLLFSASAARRKPGPKGPSPELIAAIVEMKSRNPKFGYLRIAQQISHAFGVEIDKDVVRRVLAKHYRPDPSALSGLSSAIICVCRFPTGLRRTITRSQELRANTRDAIQPAPISRARAHSPPIGVGNLTSESPRASAEDPVRQARVRYGGVLGCNAQSTPSRSNEDVPQTAESSSQGIRDVLFRSPFRRSNSLSDSQRVTATRRYPEP